MSCSSQIRSHSVEYHQLAVFLSTPAGAPRRGDRPALERHQQRFRDLLADQVGPQPFGAAERRGCAKSSVRIDRSGLGPFIGIQQYQFRAVWHEA